MEEIENGMVIDDLGFTYNQMTDEEWDDYVDYMDQKLDEMRGK